jgi:hypothetical protein
LQNFSNACNVWSPLIAHYLAGLSLSSSWNLPAPSSLPDVLTSSALILPNQIGASREISPYSALPNQLVASPPSPFSSPHAGGAQVWCFNAYF